MTEELSDMDDRREMDNRLRIRANSVMQDEAYFVALAGGRSHEAATSSATVNETKTALLASVFRSLGENASRRFAEARQRLAA